MVEPLVSVVLPIYNVEKYLDRCIESVVGQTYKNLEIILVDDGSTDSCLQKCDEWSTKDSRIKVIHKINAGLGMARNTGIDNATGKYIFFFDSDDYVDVSIIEKCVNSAIEYGSEVVVFGRNDVYDDGKISPYSIKTQKKVFRGNEVVREVLPAMFNYSMGFGVSAWGKMYDLETIKRLEKRFVSEREIISEDAYFAIDFYPDVNVISIVPEDLYYYCKRENSLSRVYNSERQKKNDIFYLKTVELAQSKGLDSDIIKYIGVRYQMYTISAMKQACRSNLSKKRKKEELKKIFKSDVLRSTLTKNIISHHSKSMKLFFTCLKYRLHALCIFLLNAKVK